MTALMMRAANASPSWMSCGFSSELWWKSGSTTLTAGRVPAVGVGDESVHRSDMAQVAEQAEGIAVSGELEPGLGVGRGGSQSGRPWLDHAADQPGRPQAVSAGQPSADRSSM